MFCNRTTPSIVPSSISQRWWWWSNTAQRALELTLDIFVPMSSAAKTSPHQLIHSLANKHSSSPKNVRNNTRSSSTFRVYNNDEFPLLPTAFWWMSLRSLDQYSTITNRDIHPLEFFSKSREPSLHTQLSSWRIQQSLQYTTSQPITSSSIH